jgi:hypothetical protein
MTIQFSRQEMAARPARSLRARSSLVRRLAQARTIRGSNAYVRGSGTLMMSSFRALASHTRTSQSCATD